MANAPEIIYCANGNKRFAEIAMSHGYTYGAQLPGTVYFTPEFVDQDWKNPVKDRYMAQLDRYRPRMATVLDLERMEQFDEVMGWAEDAAAFVTEAVIIIPKVSGVIGRIPESVGGVSVRLGFSVPTQYGGTNVMTMEFGHRPVHLLGGRPDRQVALLSYMNVVSVNGSYAKMKAVRFSSYYANDRWVPLESAINVDRPYTTFDRSYGNVIRMWRRV